MIKIDINDEKIRSKVTNNTFGLKLASEWKKLIDPYVPRDKGMLMNNIKVKPFEIHYNSVYAHFQYIGYVYEDPQTQSAWARKGVKKVLRPGNQRLVYDTSKNPLATHDWDKAAKKAGKTKTLADIMTEYLRKKTF